MAQTNPSQRHEPERPGAPASEALAEPGAVPGHAIGQGVGLVAADESQDERGGNRSTTCGDLAEGGVEELLRTPLVDVMDALSEAVFLYAPDGRIVRANRVSRTLFGLDTDPTFTRLPYAERLARIVPRDLQGRPVPPEQWHITRVLRGEVVTSDAPVDVCITTLDGRELTLSYTAAPIRDACGAIVGAISLGRDITALRCIERDAVLSASRMLAAFESMTDGVVVFGLVDGQMRPVHMNAANHALFGVQPGHLADAQIELYDDAGRLLSEEEWPYQRVLRGETLRGGNAIDMVIGRPATRRVQVSVSGAPIRDSAGEIVGGVIVHRDVTERRALERQLAERVSELQAIFAGMTDGVVVYDADGRIRTMNAASEDLFAHLVAPDYYERPMSERAELGYLRDEHDEPLPLDEVPSYRLLHGETLTDESAQDIRVHLLDGTSKLLSVTGSAVRDEHGNVVGAVAIHRDVTERRRAKRRTHEALEALLALAELLVGGDVTAAEQAAEAGGSDATGIEILGPQLVRVTAQVLGCQRAVLTAARHHGGPMEPVAAVGLSAEDERIWRTGEPKGAFLRDGMPDWLRQQLENGEAHVLDYSQPPMRERPNPMGLDKVLFVSLRVGHEVVGMLNADYGATPHDYTQEELRLAGAAAKLLGLVIERDRLLRERAAAQARALALEEINRRMDEFLSIASHELKTPVTVIKANLQLLARRDLRENSRENSRENAAGGTDSQRSGVDAQMIARALMHVERLTRLVNDMLDVSRVREGKLEFRLERIDLTPVVADVVEGQRQAHPQRDIALVVEAVGPLTVVADADRIGQVVTNYLTNALKYSCEDRPVTVVLRCEGEAVRVSVTDQGVGIPTAEQPHVWEPFRRAEGIEVQSGSGVGLGLGLYICRTIVDRHGGQVGLVSEVGQGSTFSFTLPRDASS